MLVTLLCFLCLNSYRCGETMVRIHTTVNIEESTIANAKTYRLNVSKICEEAIDKEVTKHKSAARRKKLTRVPP